MNVIDYDRKMRVNVRNSIGPQREIMAIEERTTGTLITNSCGHIEKHNQIFHYEVGTKHSCFSCRFAPDNVIGEEAQ